MLMIRIFKILNVLSLDSADLIGPRIDQLFQLNQWDLLDVFLYYLKSSDDTNIKLKDLSLSILRHLYYSGKCPLTKDRLDKLRVLEVTQFAQNSQSQQEQKA